ncbi:MAG: phosphate transport system regulatory protein PhoU [Deltaproteobacteria bacterium]|nr:MAG: phosphate transport system regulatory protein PhoU [Deltaproteobacteria bacterium]
MVRQFDRELADLKMNLLRMAEAAEQAGQHSIASVLNRNSELAKEVIIGDLAINDMELEIDEQCLKLLALRQPLAKDLRFITAAMRINADLERIGDQAVNIAERALELNQRPPLKLPIDLKKMADIALEMVCTSIEAFVHQDPRLAVQACQRDVEVDTLDDEYINKLLNFMLKDTPAVGRALHYIIIIRNIERIADLATNVAEDIVFFVEGKVIKHRYKDGMLSTQSV